MHRLFAAPAAVLAMAAAVAYGQDGTAAQARTYIEGRFDEHIAGIVKLESGDAFRLTPAAERELANLIEAEVVRRGAPLRLFFDAQHQVRDIQVMDDAAPREGPRPDRPDPARAKFEGLARSLKQGELVLVNDVKYGFKFYQNGALVLDVLGANGHGSVIIPLSQARSFSRVESETAPPPSAPPTFVPKPGDSVSVGGLEGYVEYVKGNVIHLVTREGPRDVEWHEGLEVHEIPRGKLQIAESRVVEQSPVSESEQVEIEHDAGVLDWANNTWVFHGTVKHTVRGKILLGAKLEIEARGDGRLCPADEEERILRGMGDRLPPEASGVFQYLNNMYSLRREGPEVVVAEISDIRQGRVIDLPPVFEGVPESFEWVCRADNPHDVKVSLAKLPGTFVPCGDPRAERAIIAANEGNAAHRAAALRAIAQSGRSEFLPYLLYDLYLEQGAGEQIRKSFTAFGATAEEWLLDFMKEKGYEKDLVVPTAASERPEKKKIGEPSRLVARCLELLAAVVSDRASDRAFGVALPFTRSDNEEVRAAARQIFLDRPERAVLFIMRRLRSAPEAQSVLLDIEDLKPGTLRELYAKYCPPDPGFEQAIAAEPPEVARRKLLERIRRDTSGDDSALTIDPEVVIARDLVSRIQAGAREAATLREELSKAYVALTLSPPPEGEDERHWRAEMLEQALVLDPKNAIARRALAAILLEVARESIETARVRAGPGVTYRAIATLSVGDALARASVERPDGPVRADEANYLAVKLPDGRTGWVRREVVREVRSALVVEKPVAPRSVPLGLLAKARGLDPDAREIDEAIASLEALEAREAAAAGDWKRAYEVYREALARAPGRYRWAVVGAFLRANPIVAALALILAAIAVGALAAGRAAAPTRADALARSLPRAGVEPGVGGRKKVPG